ncbi:hypothetical protein D9M68_723310 [compost metagenome]
MRGDDQARDVGSQQRVAVSRRFLGEHIGGCAAQVTTAQGVGQRLFVDQAATGGVDQKCARFHQAQLVFADQVQGVGIQGAMQGQGIHLRQQFLQWQAVLTRRAPRQLAEQYAHAKRFGQPGDCATQLAMAKQAEGFAFQLDDGVIQQAELLRLLPASRTHVQLVVRQAGRQGEQQHQRMLGHRWSAISLAVADDHTLLARSGQIDVVGAGGGDQYQFQFGAGGKGFGIQDHLVADRYLGALQAFDDLFGCALPMQLQC